MPATANHRTLPLHVHADKMNSTKAAIITNTEPSSKTLQPVAPAQPKKASSLPTNEGHAVQAVITPLSDAVKPDARVAEVVRPVMEEKLPQEAQSLPTKAPATPSLDAKAESLATAPIAVKPAEPPTAEAKVSTSPPLAALAAARAPAHFEKLAATAAAPAPDMQTPYAPAVVWAEPAAPVPTPTAQVAPVAPAAPKLTAAQLQAKEDLLAAFGATPRVPIRLLDAYATYMVVGESSHSLCCSLFA